MVVDLGSFERLHDESKGNFDAAKGKESAMLGTKTILDRSMEFHFQK